MSPLTPTTELEAVNILLATISESPVSTLEDSGLADVAEAISTLHEVSREVQTKPWDFNQEPNVTLPLDAEGHILVPPNTLRVYPDAAFRDLKLTLRGLRLYNRRDRTFAFTSPVKADLLLMLPFEELPEAARYYITIRAARIFQTRQMGEDTSLAYTRENEETAKATLKEFEGATGNYNMFTGSHSVMGTWLR